MIYQFLYGMAIVCLSDSVIKAQGGTPKVSHQFFMIFEPQIHPTAPKAKGTAGCLIA